MEKQKFRKLVITVIGAFMILGSILPFAMNDVNAEVGETTMIKTYPIFDYVKKHNFFTIDNVDKKYEKNIELSNYNGNVAYVDLLGTHGHPNNTSFNELTSSGTVIQGDGNEHHIILKNLLVNTPKFDEEDSLSPNSSDKSKWGIKIEDLDINFYAVNKDGSYATVDIYKNADYSSTSNKYMCNITPFKDYYQRECTNADIIKTITPTKENPTINLHNMDIDFNGFVLRVRDVQNVKEYNFISMQITNYKLLEEVAWTTNVNDDLSAYDKYSNEAYIETDAKFTKLSSIIPVGGEFEVDENTKDKWVNIVNATFNAGTDNLIDYPFIATGRGGVNDAGRYYRSEKNDYNDPNKPNEIDLNYGSGHQILEASTNGGYDFINNTWETTNGEYYNTEAIKNGTNNEWVRKINGYGVFWAGSPNRNEEAFVSNGTHLKSNDANWCSHNRALDYSGGSCYKYHGVDTNNTVWDLSWTTGHYAGDDERFVTGATYYYRKYNDLYADAPITNKMPVGDAVTTLANKNGDLISGNKVEGDDIASIITIQNEGIYRLYADVDYNQLVEVKIKKEIVQQDGSIKVEWVTPEENEGNGYQNDGIYEQKISTMNTQSRNFYIDLTAPTVKIEDIDVNKWYTQTPLPSVDVLIKDNLSGINKVEVVREKSKNGTAWVATDSGLAETLFDFGENDKNVRFDASNKENIKVDLNTSDGYMYYRFKLITSDIAGNISETLSPIFKYDGVPQIDYELNPKRWHSEELGQLNWTNKDVTVNHNAYDTESGVKQIQITKGDKYNVNVIKNIITNDLDIYNEEGFLVGSDFIVNEEDVETQRITQEMNYYVHVVDRNGNISTKPYIVDHIDKQVPTITWGSSDGVTWNKGSLPDITATISDDLSGVKYGEVNRYMSNDAKNWELVETQGQHVVWESDIISKKFDNELRDDKNVDLRVHLNPASGYLYYKAVVTLTDIAGNEETYDSPIIKYDEIPNISYTLNPPRLKDDNTLNWTNKDVNVNIELSDDEVGVKAVCIATSKSWDSCIQVIETWGDNNYHEDNKVSASFIEDTRRIVSDGLHLVVIDKIGNTNSIPYIVDHIDKLPPIVNFTPDGYGPGRGPIDVTIRVDDVPMKPDGARSDIKEWSYCVSNDGGVSYSCNEGLTNKETTVTINETGYNLIKVVVSDNAGNVTEEISNNYIIIGNPPTIVAISNVWRVEDGVDYRPISEVLAFAHAMSETDGDISKDIVVTRITYDNGEIVDYPEEFRCDERLSFIAEFEVTDSNGLSTNTNQIYLVEDIKSQTPENGVEKVIDVYQRYIDKYKIALAEGSYWGVKEDYIDVLNRALQNKDVKDFEIITRLK